MPIGTSVVITKTTTDEIMKKVYLIDDDSFYLKLLSKKLWEWGYTVKTFLSVEEALPNLKEEPDIIVLDHNFNTSGVKGQDYIPLLKRHSKSAAFLYVSSDESPEVVKGSLSKGADMYLIKDNTLLESIQPILNNLHEISLKRKSNFWNKLRAKLPF